MKNEITVGNFLGMLKKSIWKDFSEKSSLYDVYYGRIEGLLHGLNEKTLIKDLDSLEGLTQKSAFETFIRDSSYEELDKRFYAISMEIGTWKVHMAEMIELQGKVSLGKQRGKRGVIIISLLLVAALAGGAVLIATSFGPEMSLNGIMGAVLSVADVLLGIIFFLYEYRSDHKEKALTDNIKDAKESGSVDRIINNYNNAPSGFFGKVVDKSSIVNNYYFDSEDQNNLQETERRHKEDDTDN